MAAGYVLSERAVRALSQMLRGNAASSATTYSRAAVSPDGFAAPFAVRWSEAEGKWVIWLPDPAALVLVDDAYETIGGVTTTQTLPEGWYTIDDVADTDGDIWLVVSVTETDSGSGAVVVSVDASLMSQRGTAATGTTVYNILVATTETDATTGAKYVLQSVKSAVTISTAKSGEDGKDAGIIITKTEILASSTSPGGWTITLQPTQGGQPDGQPTSFSIYNGSGGGQSVVLSNKNPSDVVTSGGAANPGTGGEAARYDHVHKMPSNVDLLDAAQTLTETKTFSAGKGLIFTDGSGAVWTMRGLGGTSNAFYLYGATVNDTILTVSGTKIRLGSSTFRAVQLGYEYGDVVSTASLLVASRGWTNLYFLRKTEYTAPLSRSTWTIYGNTVNVNAGAPVTIGEALTVYGNPTTDAGSATETTTYTGAAAKTLRLDGLVTKGTEQTITGNKILPQGTRLIFGDPNGTYFRCFASIASDFILSGRISPSANTQQFVRIQPSEGVDHGLWLSGGNLLGDGTSPVYHSTGVKTPPDQINDGDNNYRLVATTGWIVDNFARKSSAVVNVDQVASSDDSDFAAHPYALRVTRGDGTKSFIETVPLTQELQP